MFFRFHFCRDYFGCLENRGYAEACDEPDEKVTKKVVRYRRGRGYYRFKSRLNAERERETDDDFCNHKVPLAFRGGLYVAFFDKVTERDCRIRADYVENFFCFDRFARGKHDYKNYKTDRKNAEHDILFLIAEKFKQRAYSERDSHAERKSDDDVA